MSAYYNEIDPFAAQWLRNLISAGYIAPGDVDERSIEDVKPSDIAGYTQCHFFAGIGGWSYALRLAGWPDDKPVWTGSCPCQPFSQAGQRKGFTDERHLWPSFEWLIQQLRPNPIFGEQVASADGRRFFDLLATDLEANSYSVGAADICAAAVGAPHIRQRLWWVANSDRHATIRTTKSRKELLPWPNGSKIPRVDNGIPNYLDFVRAFGNAIVPQVAAEFINAYMEVSQ